MFDLQNSIKWITAVLSEPETVAGKYRETGAPWRQSFLQITLPAYVVAYLVAGTLSLVTGRPLMMGISGPGWLLFSLLWGLAWTFVIAFIFDYLAGTFGGRRDYDRAYAVVALAIVPAALGTALTPLPWVGWLISIAFSIYALVLAYRFLPVFLEIPDSSRGKHFALSIVAAIVVNILVSMTLGAAFIPDTRRGATVEPGKNAVSGSVFGGLERQANYVDAASKDAYQPPEDGKLSDEQMERYVDVMKKTRALQERLGGSLENLEDKQPSLSDVFSGVGGAMRLSTAEMEVVKTGGWNWAEHLWVKNQLEVARIQRDLNDTTRHNYRLFERYQADIEPPD